MRLFACPRRPSRMKFCLERMALTIWGTTVSSKPTMPGKSVSRALEAANEVGAQFIFYAAGVKASFRKLCASAQFPQCLGKRVSC